MKKWVKILLVVGIVWLILVGVYLWYVCGKIVIDCELSGNCGIVQDCYSPSTFIPAILLLGVPSWIMFLVILVWGRNEG